MGKIMQKLMFVYIPISDKTGSKGSEAVEKKKVIDSEDFALTFLVAVFRENLF